LNIRVELLACKGIRFPLSDITWQKTNGWDAMLQGQELPTVMVIEDDQLVQGFVEEALAEGGFEVAAVGSGEEAVHCLRVRRPVIAHL
jgi:hypothetical protein